MGETSDKITGKAKETAGNVTDDDSLKREGKTQHAKGEAKGLIGDVKDKADEMADAVKDKLHRD